VLHQMPENDLTKFIEKKVAETGATKESVWKALDEQAELWQRRSNSKGVSPIERRELVQKVNRAGSILHTSIMDMKAMARPPKIGVS
jgi:hypothetical protein